MADTLDIAPDGDVVLIVGLPKKRIRVDSCQLAIASPVFKSMFRKDRFAEGENLSSTQPKEVELPDDDLGHATMFCNAVHFRYEALPTEVTALELRDFANFIDKYHCFRGVALLVQNWLQGLRREASGPDLIRLLEASYLMDAPEDFSSISQEIMLTCPLPLLVPAKAKRMPGRVLDDINDRMNDNMEEIKVALLKVTTVGLTKELADPNHIRSCKMPEQVIARHMLHLIHNDLWPPMLLPPSLRECGKKIAELSDVDLSGLRHQSCYRPGCPQRPDGKLDELRNEVEKVLESCDGMCLDCVKARKRLTNGSCRVKHP